MMLNLGLFNYYEWLLKKLKNCKEDIRHTVFFHIFSTFFPHFFHIFSTFFQQLPLSIYHKNHLFLILNLLIIIAEGIGGDDIKMISKIYQRDIEMSPLYHVIYAFSPYYKCVTSHEKIAW